MRSVWKSVPRIWSGEHLNGHSPRQTSQVQSASGSSATGFVESTPRWRGDTSTARSARRSRPTRPRTYLDVRSWTGPSSLLPAAVELRLVETRGRRLQNLIRPLQLSILALQIVRALAFVRRRARPVARVSPLLPGTTFAAPRRRDRHAASTPAGALAAAPSPAGWRAHAPPEKTDSDVP